MKDAAGEANHRPAPSSFALQLFVRGPTPGSHEPGSASGACFVGPRSPWSPTLAPPAPPPSPGFVRRLRRYYAGVRLLWVVHQRLRLLTFPLRTMRPQRGLWPIQRSPGSRTRSVRTCQGLRPRRARRALADNAPGDFAFRQVNNVGTRVDNDF